jgi:multiple sugar transport system ATP-binding protein
MASFLVLVAPSGCGKSTLLRLVAGLEEMSGGTISIGGTVVNDLAPKERNIGMVFQNYALYPHMTVAENMAFSLRLSRVPREERRAKVDCAAEILGWAGCSPAIRPSSRAANGREWRCAAQCSQL